MILVLSWKKYTITGAEKVESQSLNPLVKKWFKSESGNVEERKNGYLFSPIKTENLHPMVEQPLIRRKSEHCEYASHVSRTTRVAHLNLRKFDTNGSPCTVPPRLVISVQLCTNARTRWYNTQWPVDIKFSEVEMCHLVQTPLPTPRG